MSTTDSTLAPAVAVEVQDGVAMIRIDQLDKPVNVLSEQVVAELAAAIRRLEAGELEVRGAAIVTGKPGVWIAGADVDQLRGIRTAAEGEELSRSAHRLLDRLERLTMPVVAAIDGVALGGGLEVALACTYRLATDSPKTRLGLPEVQLGLVPGAGGTQRLPRLVGIRAALDLMLTGKQLDGRRAWKIGLVDEVVPAAIIAERARRAVLELADGRLRPRPGRPRGSPEWIENLPGLRGFILRKARQGVLEKTRGLYPAPLRLIELVAEGLDRPLDQALELEAAAFGELVVTPESRSLTHLFFASTAAKNDPVLGEQATPLSLDQVAVVGAGFMGIGIATVSAEAGLRVRLKDVSLDAVARGVSSTRTSLRSRAERRRLPEHEIVKFIDRVDGTVDYLGFGTIDIAVEAVFENVDLKLSVLREVAAAVPAGAVLASNTSTIPIGTLAEALDRPERLIGLHFFSPVEKMPLLEIIVTPATAPEVVATAHAYAKRIGKTPIVVHDGPGFYANRILGPYMNEAALLLQQGVRMEELDEAMLEWGFPVGPIALFDEVGLEVAAKAGEIMATAFADRVEPNSVLETMLADDRKGRKNGRGFYQYEKGRKTTPDPSVYPLIGAATHIGIARAEIQERLALGMVNEAVRALEDGILRSARDGDVGAVFGIGFPPFRGGPFWYLDEAGPAEILNKLRRLEATHGKRFAPAALLVDKAERGQRFYPGGSQESPS